MLYLSTCWALLGMAISARVSMSSRGDLLTHVDGCMLWPRYNEMALQWDQSLAVVENWTRDLGR